MAASKTHNILLVHQSATLNKYRSNVRNEAYYMTLHNFETEP